LDEADTEFGGMHLYILAEWVAGRTFADPPRTRA
jgi:hypothetical protein